MKLLKPFAVALLAAGVVAPLAVADDEGGDATTEKEQSESQAERPDREAMRKRFIKEYDKDGDGELNEEERKSAGEAMRKRFVEEFDKDGDGKLSDEERTKARETMRERFGNRGPRGEGEGRPEAKRADREAGERGPREGGDRPNRGGPTRERVLKQFDKDGNGKLNDEEAKAARKAMQERREARGDREAREDGPRDRPRRPRGAQGPPEGRPQMNRVFDHFDKNGDGQLSRDEFRTLTEIVHALRGGPEVRGRGMQRGPRGREEFGPLRGRRGPGQRRGDSPGDKSDEK